MAIDEKNVQNLLIPSYYVQQILDQLKNYPSQVEQFLIAHKLSSTKLFEPGALISLVTFKALILQAIQLTGKQSLGLLVGQNLNLTTHGMLGFAIMASRTLNEALQIVAKYLNIRTPLLALSIQQTDNHTEVQLAERYRLDEIKRPVLESAISALHSMLNHIAPELSPIKKINLPFAKPSYASTYQSQFDCDVHFSAGIASLIIDNQVLDVPLKLGNESAFKNAVALCELELTKLKQGQTVQHKVRTLLLESVDEFPSLKQVASRLNLSARTMHRNLEKEQTSFSKILSDIRYLRARTLLSSTHLPIAEIGRQLGYSEPASFRKAFRSWAKVSPKNFRNHEKSPR